MADKISGVPTPKQQKFILTELIPAILREQGSRFTMEQWFESAKNVRLCFHRNAFVKYDDILHFNNITECKSVSCVGGTAESLLYGKATIGGNRKRDDRIGKKMGLTSEETYALFYSWRLIDRGRDYHWPQEYMEAFESATSPLKKAQVVANLLTRIATEGGNCLHH